MLLDSRQKRESFFSPQKNRIFLYEINSDFGRNIFQKNVVAFKMEKKYIREQLEVKIEYNNKTNKHNNSNNFSD